MDFSPTDEQRIAVDSFRRFLEAEIAPEIAAFDDTFIPKDRMRELLGRLLPFGMGNGLVDEAQGGLCLDPLSVGLLFEELARVSPDLAIVVLIQMEAGLLLAAGSESIRANYLAPLLSGEKFACIGISEPEAGSNIAQIRCRARRDGSGFLLSGEKQWISSGHYSDFCICVARDEEAPGDGIGLFIVDREAGYESINIPKMALNRQSTAQLHFDNASVAVENVLVPPGEGLKTLMTLLAGSRPLVGLLAVGVARAAFNHAVDYAKTREQHGKVIARHQLVQARIANMAVKIDASRLLLYRALDLAGRGERSDLESSMAKYFATEAACEVTRHALAIHGGNGVAREFPVEELYRVAPILAVTEGTPEMQQLIIGRSLLGESAF
ncbi:MAG: acyl-CoA/acyl-ACP dehydrogenase [Gammaproteobacteria bacterium]|nr:acyl-CoA/acyl-ACP dehydrogenase [Gammaproteobacteria bacterium]